MNKWFTIGVLLLGCLAGSHPVAAGGGKDTLDDEESMRKARAFIEAGGWKHAYACFALPAFRGNAGAGYAKAQYRFGMAYVKGEGVKG